MGAGGPGATAGVADRQLVLQTDSWCGWAEREGGGEGKEGAGTGPGPTDSHGPRPPPVLGGQGTTGGSEQKHGRDVTGAQGGQVCGHRQAGGRAGPPPEQLAEQSRMSRHGADGTGVASVAWEDKARAGAS